MNSIKRNLSSLWVAILSVLIVAAAIFSTGAPPLEALSAFFQGIFGSKAQFEQTLSRTMPLLFTGLSVAVALRGGLFNIGAEGQLLVGALMAALVGYSLQLPPVVHPIVTLGAGALAGAVWALPAGVLKVWRGGHEVITTIMFNYLALNLVNYLLNGPMKAPGGMGEPKTPQIAQTAWLGMIPGTDNVVSFGLVIALFAAFVLWLWLSRTPSGYEVNAAGANPDAAEANGISAKRGQVLAMAMAGALAGLAGATLVMSLPDKRFYQDFSPGYGFDGLAAALLAGGNPLGVIPAAFLFAAIDVGTRFMESITPVPRDIATVVRGLVILSVAVIFWQRRGGRG